MADSSDKEARFDITANASGFMSGMQQAADSARTHSKSIEGAISSIGDAFKGLMAPLMIVGAAMAGGKFFGDAIGAANKLNGEAMGLVKSLGITGTQASALRTAMGNLGIETETYTGAFQKFAKQLHTNESGLQKLGLQTRDNNGHFRDSNTLFQEAVEVVGTYAPGLDQATVALQLFGKGASDVMQLQKLTNAEIDKAAQKNKDLGLTLTQEGAAGSRMFKASMAGVGDVLIAVKNVIGQAVMPILTRLGEWFADIGPGAVFVFKVAIDTVSTVLQVAVGLARSLWDILRGLVNPIVEVGSAFRKLLSGDVAGATQQMKTAFNGWGEAIAKGFRTAGEDLKRTGKEVANLWGQGTEVAAPKQGKRTTENTGSAATEPRLSKWEEELAAQRDALQRQAVAAGNFRQMTKAEEQVFWAAILAQHDITEKEKIAVSRKYYGLASDIRKDAFEAELAGLAVQRDEAGKNYGQRILIAEEMEVRIAKAWGNESTQAVKANGEVLKERRALAEQLRHIEAATSETRRKVAQDDLSADRADALAGAEIAGATALQKINIERQFMARKHQLEIDDQQWRLTLLDPSTDPEAYQKAKDKLLEIEAKYRQDSRALNTRAVSEIAAPWKAVAMTLESSFASAMDGILLHTQTIGGAMRQLFTGILQTFTQEMITKPLALMAMRALRETTLYQWMAGAAATSAAASAGATIVAKGTEATAVVGANAAEAASGAAASVASIPWVGPVLAAAAFASMMALVMGSKSSIKSAAGGYDIPSTINPMVQAHASEMILPAKYADVIRGLAGGKAQAGMAGMAGGQGSGGDTHVHLNVTAMDGDSVKQLLLANSDALAVALRRAHRLGHFV